MIGEASLQSQILAIIHNVQLEITDSGLGILLGEQCLWSLGKRKAAQDNNGAIQFTDQAGQRYTFTLRLRAAAERTVL